MIVTVFTVHGQSVDNVYVGICGVRTGRWCPRLRQSVDVVLLRRRRRRRHGSAKCEVQSAKHKHTKDETSTSTYLNAAKKLHVGTTHHPPPGHHHHYGQTDEWRTDLCLGQTETVDGVETSFQCYCYSASHYLRYSQLSPIAVLLKVINYEYYEQ